MSRMIIKFHGEERTEFLGGNSLLLQHGRPPPWTSTSSQGEGVGCRDRGPITAAQSVPVLPITASVPAGGGNWRWRLLEEPEDPEAAAADREGAERGRSQSQMGFHFVSLRFHSNSSHLWSSPAVRRKDPLPVIIVCCETNLHFARLILWNGSALQLQSSHVLQCMGLGGGGGVGVQEACKK